MSISLPPVIAAYFEADRGAGEGVASCFTSDAVVRDEGQTYEGLSSIRKWRAEVAEKFTYTCEPLTLADQDQATVVTCRLEGDFPGSPANLRFFFQTDGEKIASLEIIP